MRWIMGWVVVAVGLPAGSMSGRLHFNGTLGEMI